MGFWGAGLLQSDAAYDIRGAVESAVFKTIDNLARVETVPHEGWPFYWVTLAAVCLEFGYMPARVHKNALAVIADGSELASWTKEPKRKQVLDWLKATLLQLRKKDQAVWFPDEDELGERGHFTKVDVPHEGLIASIAQTLEKGSQAPRRRGQQ